MHPQGKEISIRFLAENATTDAEACAPNIEDAYMFYLKKNGAELEVNGNAVLE